MLPRRTVRYFCRRGKLDRKRWFLRARIPPEQRLLQAVHPPLQGMAMMLVSDSVAGIGLGCPRVRVMNYCCTSELADSWVVQRVNGRQIPRGRDQPYKYHTVFIKGSPWATRRTGRSSRHATYTAWYEGGIRTRFWWRCAFLRAVPRQFG